MAGGMLYRVDLATGKASEHGKVGGAGADVTDIAVLPKM